MSNNFTLWAFDERYATLMGSFEKETDAIAEFDRLCKIMPDAPLDLFAPFVRLTVFNKEMKLIQDAHKQAISNCAYAIREAESMGLKEIEIHANGFDVVIDSPEKGTVFCGTADEIDTALTDVAVERNI